MKNLKKLLMWSVIIILLTAGCSDLGNPLNSSNNALNDIGTPRLTVPSGADFVSASMILNVTSRRDQAVTIHRITSAWSESEVTWINFDGAYDSLPVTSFVPASFGAIEVDVSALVQTWLNGTNENHGILLKQTTFMSQYSSSQATDPNLRPQLVVRYMTASGLDSTMIQNGVSGVVEDAYIGSNFGYGNNGNSTLLMAGIAFGFEHRALIKFQMDISQPQYNDLGDYVWNDQDQDGIQDADEPGMPLVTVNLYDDRFNLMATTYTNADGYYLFDGIADGDYFLKFIPPAEYIFSPSNSGLDDAIDSDVDSLTGRIGPISLTSGKADMSWDAGLFIPAIVHDYEVCTHGPGYWKNYAGHGPQKNYFDHLLPIWLGYPGGEKSIEVTSAEVTSEIIQMHIYGQPSNGITKLYAKLLTAKLNIVHGAYDTDIADVIDEVDAYLTEHDWNDWKKLTADEIKIIKIWISSINDYISGEIGPGNCDDVQDEGELDDN